uniref:IMV membrane protein n=1 Tax=Steinernema glaseri TaxID=37863 RepID=A0A1I7Z850_9BILA
MTPLIDVVQNVLYCLLALFTVVALYVISINERQRRLADRDIPEMYEDVSLRTTALRNFRSVLERIPRRASENRSSVATQ